MRLPVVRWRRGLRPSPFPCDQGRQNRYHLAPAGGCPIQSRLDAREADSRMQFQRREESGARAWTLGTPDRAQHLATDISRDLVMIGCCTCLSLPRLTFSCLEFLKTVVRFLALARRTLRRRRVHV